MGRKASRQAVARPPRLAPNPASAPVTPSQSAPKPHLYFINAFADFGLIGGISLLVYLIMRFAMDGSQRIAPLVTLGAQLSWICNWPHFAATSYRLYHSPANIRQYPLTALVIPPLLAALVIGSILSPTGIAPYLAKIYFLWSPYHFSGQTLGITLIYARRAGFQVGPWERRGLSTFIFGSFLVLTAQAESGAGENDFYGIKYLRLGVPDWLPWVFSVFMWVGGALLIARIVRWCRINKRLLPLIVLVPALTQYVWFVLSGHAFPLAELVPPFLSPTVKSWTSSQLLPFVEFVPFFHCMQYLLIAWSMQLKEKLDLQTQGGVEPTSSPTPRQGWNWPAEVLSTFGVLVLAVLGQGSPSWAHLPLIVVGLLLIGLAWMRGWFLSLAVSLFVLLPPMLSAPSFKDSFKSWELILAHTVPLALLLAGLMQRKEASLTETVRPSASYVVWETLRWGLINYAGGVMLFFILPALMARQMNLNLLFATGVTMAAVQIHHFFVDGVIWKLKRKTVASPLMVNLSDLLGSTPRPHHA